MATHTAQRHAPIRLACVTSDWGGGIGVFVDTRDDVITEFVPSVTRQHYCNRAMEALRRNT